MGVDDGLVQAQWASPFKTVSLGSRRERLPQSDGGSEVSTKKLIKDGQVAVIVSTGYGAGWSTWNIEYGEKMVFDPVLAQMILDGKSNAELDKYAKEAYPDAYIGGLGKAEVEWVAVGSRFMIDEYDGYESIVILSPEYGYTA